MNWSALTAAEVLQEFNSAEKDAFDAVKGNDMLASITARVVERIRSAIEWGGGVLQAAGTIPNGLKGEGIAIARWRYLISLPKNEALQTAERKAANDEAIALLEKIARGEIAAGFPEGDLTGSNIPGKAGSQTRVKMRTEAAS